MDYLFWVLLISLSACACTSAYDPLNRRPVRDTTYNHRIRDTSLDQRLVRENNAPGNYMLESRRHPVYSNDFLDDYEPYAYAAIPIHAPMPVLHVISPTANSAKYRPKKYVRPQPEREREYAYSSSSVEQSYDGYSQEEYADSVPKPKYSSYYEEEAPVLVYARPNKNGGYTYRKPSASSSKAHSQKEPFIIRIHKYKLIRDR